MLVGLVAAVLTAVAGTRDWATSSGDPAAIEVAAAASGSDTAPLASALALLALASWGVVLVTRRHLRQVVALVGCAASIGVLVAVVDAFDTAQDDALEALMGQPGVGDTFATSLTAWYYLTGASAAVGAAAFAVAVWRCAGWPAMGSRYDAPSARAGSTASARDGDAGQDVQDGEDMWRALDRGQDPTS